MEYSHEGILTFQLFSVQKAEVILLELIYSWSLYSSFSLYTNTPPFLSCATSSFMESRPFAIAFSIFKALSTSLLLLKYCLIELISF